MTTEAKLKTLAERWAHAAPAERANAQSYLIELCAALDVEPPRPAGSGYEFEFAVVVVNRDGTESTNFVDLFKRGHFVLEAKDQDASKPDSQLLHRAYGQARAYAAAIVGDPPPYLLVLDVGKTLLVWDRWSGSYGGFQASRRVDLRILWSHPDEIALIRDIFQNPAARDPRGRAAAVTREIAEKLARLAASLEERGHHPVEVAQFLMRCVFTMFAEDVGLLSGEPFTSAIDEVGFHNPEEFQEVLGDLWRAMDKGERFGMRKFLRFNGHFFKEVAVLPLTKDDLAVLAEAATSEWSEVEPSVMGTLLTRALDPLERHRLGAEYTPRGFVERVVRPTVEEPIRERWTAVQAEVLQLLDPTGKTPRTQKHHRKEAIERLREFHGWLCALRFLDPACGSGNFLYVTLAIVKQVELEVIREIEAITKAPELAVEEVGPWQFHGIEVKAWAREIAELTLWIGYHQWWRRTHGHIQPPEPVLRDTGTLEHRDAVLAWDEIVEDPARSRPDPTPRIRHTVTGELVPDPDAKTRYLKYEGARQAEWPQADFIVGNPPYMGRGRQRDAFGDGYVEALREVYADVPDNADYVMYWWYRASELVASGAAMRAGFITTNTITQRHNREVIEHAAEGGACVIWAVANHPWIDETGSAAVRVAMTVIARSSAPGTLIAVNDEGVAIRQTTASRVHSDLTGEDDVVGAAACPLRANKGISSQGFTLVGEGFRLSPEEGERLASVSERHGSIVRRIVNGRDLTARPRGIYTIDFALMTEEDARAYPTLFDLVRDRVRPARQANKRESYGKYWWRFGETRSGLREALQGLARYMVTVETAKHRVFQFLPIEVAAEHSVVCIALENAFHLGVLSSSIHVRWALAAGGRLGVGNDPRYQKAMCFDPFPFPEADTLDRTRITTIAEQIEQHRREAMRPDERVTITTMYNVVDKLRNGEALTDSERIVHEVAACGVLRDLHDELDAAVAAAYGWSWPLNEVEILSRLVDLHDRRAEEERAGHVRWLRPEYQAPRFGGHAPGLALAASTSTQTSAPGSEAWPGSTIEQIAAIQRCLGRGPASVDEIAASFRGARRDVITRHLETLALMGELRIGSDGAYHLVLRVA